MSELVCGECGKTWPEEKLNNYHNHIYTSHKLNTDSYIERYRRVKKEIPEKYHDAYEAMTGHGRSPKSVQATVCYIESGLTQKQVAEVWDTCGFTITEVAKELMERGVVTLEEIRENNPDNGKQMFGEKRYKGEESPNLKQ